MPHLEADFWQKSKDQGLVVLGVNREEDADTAKKFVAQNQLTFPVFLDPRREFYSKFTPKYIPWNVVIGPDMKLLYSKAGYDAKELEAAVAAALKAAETK